MQSCKPTLLHLPPIGSAALLSHAKLSAYTVLFTSNMFSSSTSSLSILEKISVILPYLHISNHHPARRSQWDMHRCILGSVHLSEEQAGRGSCILHLPCSLHTSFCLLVQQLTGVTLFKSRCIVIIYSLIAPRDLLVSAPLRFVPALRRNNFN